MIRKISVFLFLLASSDMVFAKSLCIDGSEEVIFSFKKANENKLVSICKESHSAYLVYRFGTPQKIELQFPKKLDRESWNKFRLDGRYRGGGKRNLAFSDYILSFDNEEIRYSIFDNWDAVEGTYSIGVIVDTGKKTYLFSGDKKTQKGTLRQLEWESENIKNEEFGEEPK